MAIYNSPTYAKKLGAITEGLARNHLSLHDTVSVPASFGVNDTANIGYLPPGAIVSGVTVKAATQLDSGGALSLNVGVSGTPALFMNAITTVGRVAGPSAEFQMAAAGRLYKNTTGAKQAVVIQPATASAAGLAGTLEVAVTYWVEEPAATPA